MKLRDLFNSQRGRGLSRYANLLPGVLVLIAGLFYLLVWDHPPLETADSPGYMRIAADLQDLEIENPSRAPGYPLLLLLTNSVEEPTRLLFVVQLVLHLLAVVLLAYLLDSIGVSKKLVALFMVLSLIPPSLVTTFYVLTETLATFLLVLGFVTLVVGLHRRKLALVALSAVALSWSALTRPTFQLLFVVAVVLLAVLLFCARESRLFLTWAIVLMLAIPSLVLGGYSLSNYRDHGFFGLTPLLGFNLGTRTARFLEALPDEYADVRSALIRIRNQERVGSSPRATATRPWYNASHDGLLYIWRAKPALHRLTGIESSIELSEYLVDLNLLLIRRKPFAYLKEIGLALPTYWESATTSVTNFRTRALKVLWGGVHALAVTAFFFLVPFLIGCGLMLIRLPAETRQRLMGRASDQTRMAVVSFVLAVSVVGYTMLVSTAVETGNPRFRVPTDLLIFFVVALGIDFWGQLRKNLPRLGG